MFDVARLPLSQMVQASAALRSFGEGATSMEACAGGIVRYLYDELGDGQDQRACALVRFYKTHPYAGLDPDLRSFARGVLGGDPPRPSMSCLTMLATAGEQPAWNERTRSAQHRAIPLPSPEVIAEAPMIAQLISQFGLETRELLEPDPGLLTDLAQKTYNVFHVAKALGSPYVPAQDDFVVRHGIESVVGFGGLFPTGDLFAVILFSKIPIPRETAGRFTTLALSVKLAALPFANGPVFRGEAGDAAEAGAAS